MKIQKSGWWCVSAAGLGFALALCLGAATAKPNAESVAPLKADWTRLKLVTYPNGGTGFFDPDTGTMYVYDAGLQKCYLTQQLKTLGEPMQRPRN